MSLIYTSQYSNNPSIFIPNKKYEKNLSCDGKQKLKKNLLRTPTMNKINKKKVDLKVKKNDKIF